MDGSARNSRVLLADDQGLEGHRRPEPVLEPEFEIVGAVGDGRALLEAAERLKPDLILAESRCLCSTESRRSAR